MDFKSILNAELLKQAMQKCNHAEVQPCRSATMPQIRMSGMPQVRVGDVGRAMRLIGNHTHFCAIQE